MVHYQIEIADAQAHLFRVTLTLAAPAAEQAFSLPVWIPGSYMVREFSRHLSGLRARQGQRELAVQQTSKCAWQVRCSGRAALVLSYQVYAFDTSVRAAFLDTERGFFNGTSLCLRVHGREHEAHGIELAGLLPGWQVATGMRAGRGKASYEAADYDELVDHPFELGKFWRGQFSAAGVPHEFVVAGAYPILDGERLLRDAQRICEAQINFWHGDHKPGKRVGKPAGKPPFERYVFLLNAVDDSYGGLEHRASTALIAARRDLPRLGQAELSEGYVRLLGLISHEYFHTWNVKRLRPDVFASFDYGQENYTQLLWFFEGFTSYYDELFLVRSGLIDEARYLKLLASTFSGVLAAPGRKHQSVAQSSFDAWVKYYRQDENTPNAVVSYYTKGSMVAMALDLALRSADQPSGCSVHLDALMRLLWQRSGGGGPIGEADIMAAVTELGGAALAQDLTLWVHGTDDLPLPALLERFGLRWAADKASLAQRIGLRVSEENGSIVVKQVLQGSAALAAGFCAGDEILACNGWRLRKLEDALLCLQPERLAQMEWLVVRDQRVLTLLLHLPTGEAAATPVALSPEAKAPARALSLRRAWLGG
ncbi:PDZ domain-containing protein [Paucibacter sp. AS307]|uniref:M61 family metallopeptidase n=1 Tax=Paucibacter soli TaxID=3133433 RepID=UPI0030949815